jgi:antitoxin MazE
MKLQVAKWGNSLAVRLPAECARAVGLTEGDCVEAEVTAAGQIFLTPAKPFEKAAFLSQIRKRRAAMPLTDAVVESLRKEARY